MINKTMKDSINNLSKLYNVFNNAINLLKNFKINDFIINLLTYINYLNNSRL
jgi:hypothetical protein